MNDSLDNFAKRLAFSLENKDVKERELAAQLNVSQQAINNWKLGKNKSKKMYEAAKFLDVDPQWLIEGDGHTPNKKDSFDLAIEDVVSRLKQDKKKTLLNLAKALEKEDASADE